MIAKYLIPLFVGVFLGREFDVSTWSKVLQHNQESLPVPVQDAITYVTAFSPLPYVVEETPWPSTTLITVCRNGRSNESISFYPGTDFELLKTWSAQRIYTDSHWRTHKLFNTFGLEIQSTSELRNSIVSENRTRYVLVPDGDFFIWPSFQVGHEEVIHRDECRDRFGDFLKLKTATIHPKSFTVDDFVTEEEVEFILNFGLGKIKRSKVFGSNGTDQVSKSRNSEHTWLNSNEDPLVNAISQRISTCLSHVPNDITEPFQVVHYNPDQHYHAHHDYFDIKTINPPPEPVKAGKNRFLTVLFYLNDVEEGGWTNFPQADDWASSYNSNFSSCEHGVSVTPKKYSVIMFYSLTVEGHMAGETDPRSLHAGCDVIKGEKWAANKWIHNRAFPGNPGNVIH